MWLSMEEKVSELASLAGHAVDVRLSEGSLPPTALPFYEYNKVAMLEVRQIDYSTPWDI